jgi:hypothetical protein
VDEQPDEFAWTVAWVASEHLRAPSNVTMAEGEPLFTFDPPLTSQEQATLDLIIKYVRSGMTVTYAGYLAIRPHLTTIRDLRQMGRNAFMALTAAERDRLLYDAQAATTTILLAMLRE